MEIEVTRPAQGWSERALLFLPGTVVQYLSAAGYLVRARCAGEFWHVQRTSETESRTTVTGPALLKDMADAPRLRVLAAF